MGLAALSGVNPLAMGIHRAEGSSMGDRQFHTDISFVADAKIENRKAGPINAKTTRKALESMFGKKFLKDVNESAGEGLVSEEKTIISMPNFEGVVVWGEGISSFCGYGRNWQTSNGVKIGSSVSTLTGD